MEIELNQNERKSKFENCLLFNFLVVYFLKPGASIQTPTVVTFFNYLIYKPIN